MPESGFVLKLGYNGEKVEGLTELVRERDYETVEDILEGVGPMNGRTEKRRNRMCSLAEKNVMCK